MKPPMVDLSSTDCSENSPAADVTWLAALPVSTAPYAL